MFSSCSNSVYNSTKSIGSHVGGHTMYTIPVWSSLSKSIDSSNKHVHPDPSHYIDYPSYGVCYALTWASVEDFESSYSFCCGLCDEQPPQATNNNPTHIDTRDDETTSQSLSPLSSNNPHQLSTAYRSQDNALNSSLENSLCLLTQETEVRTSFYF